MKQGPWYNSLRVLVVLLLTLALFPLGTIAVYQTSRVSAEAERNAQLALLAVTGRAAKTEELLIERAFGAARVIANTVEMYIDNPELCQSTFAGLVADDPLFVTIGLLPSSKVMTCTSSGRSFDFNDYPGVDEMFEKQIAAIDVSDNGPISGTSIFAVSEPYTIDGEFAGFVTISIPHSGLPETSGDLTDLGLVELMTFNTDGEVLTSRGELEDALVQLPDGTSLLDLKYSPSRAFSAVNTRGELRTYTVVPIAGSPATVLGVWQSHNGLAQRLSGSVYPWVFPVLMWVASMSVAMLSIYMLVLRHLTTLRGRMNAFATDRSSVALPTPAVMPSEVQDLYEHFDQMVDVVIREEARMEDALREKNVLIKEIHHRVKNNLQLISSIMSMQIRSAEQDETRTVLSRLQDRVLSLATIHRDLYQSDHGGRVNVGALVSEVIENSLDVAVSSDDAITLETDIDDILLYPDQAVPMSLLVAEAATNALKYVGYDPGETSRISMSLKQDGQDCVMTMSNTLGTSRSVESTGLGAQLMNAFAIQLGGRIETEKTDKLFVLTLRFKVADFAPDGRDF